jgi:hypothetical protein
MYAHLEDDVNAEATFILNGLNIAMEYDDDIT